MQEELITKGIVPTIEESFVSKDVPSTTGEASTIGSAYPALSNLEPVKTVSNVKNVAEKVASVASPTIAAVKSFFEQAKIDRSKLAPQKASTTPKMDFSDIDVVGSIANAIKQVESNGNYEIRGASGEYGAYQFMPNTWKEWAGKYIGNPNAEMTQKNQDTVARARIEDLLNQGYNAEQIALIWNGGEPVRKSGTNKFGVKYDSGAYANKVLAAMEAQSKARQSSMAQKYPNLTGMKLSDFGVVTTPFKGSTKFEKVHPAIDIANKKGTPIPAFTPGVITEVVLGKKQGDKGYGNYVVVTDPQGNQHRYSHLHNAYVQVGQRVAPGQVLGGMGSTGSVYSLSGGDGTHLDYRVKNAANKYIDPNLFLKSFFKGA